VVSSVLYQMLLLILEWMVLPMPELMVLLLESTGRPTLESLVRLAEQQACWRRIAAGVAVAAVDVVVAADVVVVAAADVVVVADVVADVAAVVADVVADVVAADVAADVVVVADVAVMAGMALTVAFDFAFHVHFRSAFDVGLAGPRALEA
jgi:hypothetical protein